jgi:hypothetical protein
MADKVLLDPTVPIKRIYNDVVIHDSQRGDDIPDFNCVRSILVRKRSSQMPAIPRTIAEVDIVGEWRRTWTGQRFLSLLDDLWGIAIFATKKNFKILQVILFVEL